MEVEGRFAYLTPLEAADGLENPFELNDENVRKLGNDIEKDRKNIQKFKAESDTLDHSVNSRILEMEGRQSRRLLLLLELAAETEMINFSDKLNEVGPDEFLDLTR